jgi:hypothetical protein
MATYFVDSAATGAGTGADWENAYTSIAALSTALSGNFGGHLVYVADTHNEPGTGAAKTLNCTSAATMISSDVLTGMDVSYLKGTGNQYYTADGAYGITIDGPWSIYGIKFVSGAGLAFAISVAEPLLLSDCGIVLGSGGSISGAATARVELTNCIIDTSADSGDQSAAVITATATPFVLRGATFTGAGGRTGAVIATGSSGNQYIVSGSDFSDFDNATACELVSCLDLTATFTLSQCKTKSSPARITTDIPRGGTVFMANVGPSDDPSQLLWRDRYGQTESSTSVFLSASIESVPVSWGVSTTSNAKESVPHYTPWIYGTTTAGTKTFDLYIAHDAKGGGAGSDLTDAECWLEVEVMGTSGVGMSTLHTDKRATITTGAAVQTDDASTWTGSPGSNLQKLSCASVTVGEAGLYRARVAVGKASAGPIYVDPKVQIS